MQLSILLRVVKLEIYGISMNLIQYVSADLKCTDRVEPVSARLTVYHSVGR